MHPTALDLSDDRIAEAVHTVGQRSYRVEADLIAFDGIPALHESLVDMCAEPLRWLGILDPATGLPVAFIAYAVGADGTVEIDRLCVDPDWFRKGLARALLTQLLADNATADAIVSTGAANTPAVTLYTRAGFMPAGTSSPAPGLEIAHFRLTRASG